MLARMAPYKCGQNGEKLHEFKEPSDNDDDDGDYVDELEFQDGKKESKLEMSDCGTWNLVKR